MKVADYTFLSTSECEWVNPFMPGAAKKRPDYLGDISLTKAHFVKYLKEKCSSELSLNISFKYLVKSCFIPKLFSKVSFVQKTLSGVPTFIHCSFHMIQTQVRGSQLGLKELDE